MAANQVRHQIDCCTLVHRCPPSQVSGQHLRSLKRSNARRLGDDAYAHLAAWSYPQAYAEVVRISNFVSFEPDIVSVQLDGARLHLEPGQSVIAHGPDRDLTVAQLLPPASAH